MSGQDSWQDSQDGLTALDIREADFKVRMRGYDQDEVNRFLDKVADMVQNQKRELDRLRHDKQQADQRLDHFYQLERHIQDAIVLARKTAEEVVTQARREGDLIVEEARIQARDAQQDLDRLYAERERTLLELRAMLQSQLAGLERHLKRDNRTVASEPQDNLEGDTFHDL